MIIIKIQFSLDDKINENIFNRITTFFLHTFIFKYWIYFILKVFHEQVERLLKQEKIEDRIISYCKEKHLFQLSSQIQKKSEQQPNYKGKESGEKKARETTLTSGSKSKLPVFSSEVKDTTCSMFYHHSDTCPTTESFPSRTSHRGAEELHQRDKEPVGGNCGSSSLPFSFTKPPIIPQMCFTTPPQFSISSAIYYLSVTGL